MVDERLPEVVGSGPESRTFDPSDRVGLMLEIFATKLDATQQRVYLAKNRLAQETAGSIARAGLPAVPQSL